MATKIPKFQSTAISSVNKNSLRMNDFKIYTGMYHHKIIISRNGNTITVTHQYVKLTNNEIENTKIDNPAASFQNISSLPTYTNYITSSNEILLSVMKDNDANTDVKSTILSLNRAQIKTDIQI